MYGKIAARSWLDFKLGAAEKTRSSASSKFVLVLAMGVLPTQRQAQAADFNVGDEASLRNAISSAQNGDTINFTADITLTENLPTVQSNVTINGVATTHFPGPGRIAGCLSSPAR